jgi:hypothetical protein
VDVKRERPRVARLSRGWPKAATPSGEHRLEVARGPGLGRTAGDEQDQSDDPHQPEDRVCVHVSSVSAEATSAA